MSRVRVHIEIEGDYVEAIMARFGVRTESEAVDLALRRLAEQPMTRPEALALRGSSAISALPNDHGPRSYRASTR